MIVIYADKIVIAVVFFRLNTNISASGRAIDTHMIKYLYLLTTVFFSAWNSHSAQCHLSDTLSLSLLFVCIRNYNLMTNNFINRFYIALCKFSDAIIINMTCAVQSQNHMYTKTWYFYAEPCCTKWNKISRFFLGSLMKNERRLHIFVKKS